MPHPAIPTIASLVVLSAACGGSSARHSERAAVTTGDETPGLPSPEVYAAQLDAKGRYWWQRPKDVVERLECEPGMTVVDLGAGTGYFVPYLSAAVERDGRVVALDTDNTMVGALERRVAHEHLFNVSPRLVPTDDPELELASADRILVVNTWHHIVNRVEYAKKLRVALRPGGRVMIVEFNENSPKGPPASMRLSPHQVIEEFDAAGFSAKATEETLPYQYVIVAEARD